MAADQGLPAGQISLGGMYDKGLGVPQDYKEAAKWYRMAADQGHANARNNLGAMYENSQGVLKLNVVAYALYNLAAIDSTSDVPKENREVITKEMTAAKIEAGQTLSRKMFKPGNFTAALDGFLNR